MDLSSLNPAQYRATTHEGHVLATACPGSGKTRMLVCRATYLLDRNPKDKIGAVTFTREAATELRNRIAQEKSAYARRVQAGTFHALCGQQLRNAGFRQKVMNDGDAKKLLANVMRRKHSSLDLEDVLRYIGAQKALIDNVLPFEGFGGNESEYRMLLKEYNAEMVRRGHFDFADMIREAVLGMRSGRIAPLPVQHLLVDEFQDTDDAQLRWVLAHADVGIRICCVGDDDQSIYSWRGALGYRGLMAFRDAVDATHVSLETTYRCAKDIVAAASRLISQNVDRVPKTLRTEHPGRGDIHVHAVGSREDEAQRIVEAIRASAPDGGVLPPKSWAVLARTNAQIDDVQKVFQSSGIACERLGGPDMWESLIGRTLLGLGVAIATNRFDPIARLLTDLTDDEDISDRLREKLGEDASLDDFVRMGLLAGEPPVVTSLRRKCRSWRVALIEDEDDESLLIDNFGVWLSETLPAAKLKPKSKDSKPPLELCLSVLKKLKGSFLDRQRWIQDLKPKGDAAVTLMTMHRSKGLEFDHVWIVGCEDGITPSADAPLEEERRLFYVAMTRARNTLHCSFLHGNDAVRSMFLEEAGIGERRALAAAA